MDLVTGIAVFLMLWWTTLFAVLPWGIETDPVTGQIGAPKVPQLLRKFVATTLIALFLWGIIYIIVSQPHLFSMRDAARQIPLQGR